MLRPQHRLSSFIQTKGKFASGEEPWAAGVSGTPIMLRASASIWRPGLELGATRHAHRLRGVFALRFFGRLARCSDITSGVLTRKTVSEEINRSPHEPAELRRRRVAVKQQRLSPDTARGHGCQQQVGELGIA